MGKPQGAMGSPFGSGQEFKNLSTEQQGMPQYTNLPLSEQKRRLAEDVQKLKEAQEQQAEQQLEAQIEQEVQKRLAEMTASGDDADIVPTGTSKAVNVFSGPDLVAVITRCTALKLEPTSASPLGIETQIGGVDVVITKA